MTVETRADMNKDVIRRFVDEVINRGNFDAANELVAEDFVELDPFPGQAQGRAGLVQVIGAFRNAFPDINWVMEEMVGEGEMVCSRFIWHGTHRNEFLGIGPTGKAVSVPGFVFDKVVNGKMQESRILMNVPILMQQLGVMPG
jgi:steroid delta-isomerase-like uncharacterized protein